MMNNWLKSFILTSLIIIGFYTQAAEPPQNKNETSNQESRLVLDKVVFQISAQQWVNAEKALLSVDINATFNSTDLIKARADIMATLKKIAPGDWQITNFNRGQESSGLDKLEAAAQVRVSAADLTNIYQNAKTVSKPGITYTINKVEFKPSLKEEQAVKKELRSYLYEQVNLEIAAINKSLNGQHYTLHELVFLEGDTEGLQARNYVKQPVTMLMSKQQNSPPALIVSSELIMTAVIELASNRNQVNVVKTS